MNPVSTTGDFGRTARTDWDKRFLDYSQESISSCSNVVYAWERWVDSDRRSVSMELIDAVGKLRSLLEVIGKYEAHTGDGGRR